jgi:hypothetical protein
MAGAVIPMNLTLDVTLRPGNGDELLDTLLARHVPNILKWAARSPANAQLLLVDPITAVARSGVKLTRPEQLALEQQLGRQTATDILPPGARVARFDVKVAHAPKGGSRG